MAKMIVIYKTPAEKAAFGSTISTCLSRPALLGDNTNKGVSEKVSLLFLSKTSECISWLTLTLRADYIILVPNIMVSRLLLRNYSFIAC